MTKYKIIHIEMFHLNFGFTSNISNTENAISFIGSRDFLSTIKFTRIHFMISFFTPLFTRTDAGLTHSFIPITDLWTYCSCAQKFSIFLKLYNNFNYDEDLSLGIFITGWGGGGGIISTQ